jgi:hypothetical protein
MNGWRISTPSLLARRRATGNQIHLTKEVLSDSERGHPESIPGKSLVKSSPNGRSRSSHDLAQFSACQRDLLERYLQYALFGRGGLS